MKETFWTLLKESVILQAILTLLIWSAVVYLAVTSQQVPELLSISAAIVLGYYFGTKQAMTAAQAKG